MLDTYDVAVVALIPVKRLVRVNAATMLEARSTAVEIVQAEAENEESHAWSIPSRSRNEVESDQDLLGPTVTVHFENIERSPVIMSGMCPTRVEVDSLATVE